MNIGKMRHRIMLKKPVTNEDVGFGSVTEWVDAGLVWAEFLKQRITPNVIMGNGAAVLITQGIRIRPREIEKGWHVEEKGRVYRVIDVDRSDPAVYILTTETLEA